MVRLLSSCAVALAASLLIACGGGGSSGGSGDKKLPVGSEFSLSGRVTAAGQNGQGAPLPGAAVHLTVDRNGNGRIDDGERVTVRTDAGGNYEAAIVAQEGRTVVVSFESEGYASHLRRVEGGGGGVLVLNAVLDRLEQLGCTGARCATEDNKLSISGLREGLTGGARVFNPVTETHSFPGGFDDSDGNLLISGVFSAVELRDETGQEVDHLEAEAELRMQIPRDTWSVIVDLQPGNGRIDLPFYAFDEVQGTWVRHGQDGWLEDGDGAIVPESAGEAVRSGAFPGVLVAAAKVNHFSYWNLDWPVESHGCIGGVVRSEAGALVAGAMVTASGVTYTGTSGGQLTGADGRFRLNVMRSEGSDDVDQDGVPGETHRVTLRVIHDGNVYALGEFDAPAEPGNGGANCSEEELVLRADRIVAAGLCTLRGTVVGLDGNPVEGAAVMAWDDTLDYDTVSALCGIGWENCNFFAETGADGAFEITAAVLDYPTVWASHSQEGAGFQSLRWSYVRFAGGCPAASLQVRLDEGWDLFEFTVAVDGDAISWAPALPGTFLLVSAADGTPKWGIFSEGGGSFGTPVRYGEVPAGAVQSMPWDGTAPAPLASGDLVSIQASDWSATGIRQMGSGSGVVP